MRGKPRGETFWAEQVRAWRESGLRQVQYCARHRLSVASLQYWSSRLVARPRALSLVPVARAQVLPAAGCVLRGPEGWAVEFTAAPPAAYLAELLVRLR